jgi:hypothetical protein
MSRLWKKWAALGALGALALGPMSASAWDLSNTTTRAVVLETEDTPCDNGTGGGGDDYGADTFSNRFCIGAGVTAGRGSLPAGGAGCCAAAGSNTFCVAAGFALGGASACCTGPGTGACTEPAAGTCDADNALPPNFGVPALPAGCTTYASPAADFTDRAGLATGPPTCTPP